MDDSTISHVVQALPPLSNRGVTKSSGRVNTGVTTSVDWLRYSVPWPAGEIPEENRDRVLRQAVHPSDKIFFTGEMMPAPKGYDTCLALNCGTVRYHSAVPKQKIGVEFTGRNLSELRRADLWPEDLLAHVRQVGGKISRIDLAIDIFGRDAPPMDMHRAFLAGELVTYAKVVSQIEQKRREDSELKSDGVTVYIGSRTSERFIRVYDKAREQNLDDVKWTRIECVVGGDLASVLGPAITRENNVEFIQAVVRGFCDAPTVAWYHDAVTGPAQELPFVPRRDSDRKRWLLRQVLPALQAELVECERADDWELYDAFWQALQIYIHREGG